MSMRKTFLLAYVVVFLLVGVATAVAATMTIGDANKAQSDTEATITGEVGLLGGNDFTLTDSTGTIKFECGPTWYKAMDLKVGEKVTVTGEIDKGKTGASTAELDAFSVTKADGTTVAVRAGSGKPPWAGGKGKGGAKSGRAGAVEDNCDETGSAKDKKPAGVVDDNCTDTD
jgi:uncharacterized protein YdeI (BOF family)